MKTIRKQSVFFTIGGIGYGIVECVWRGHTHWTMLLAGGFCAVIINRIAGTQKRLPMIIKVLQCAGAITGVELLFGLIFNKLFRMNVWDYSRAPFNFMGQICLGYSLLWALLSICVLPLMSCLNRIWDKHFENPLKTF